MRAFVAYLSCCWTDKHASIEPAVCFVHIADVLCRGDLLLKHPKGPQAALAGIAGHAAAATHTRRRHLKSPLNQVDTDF